MRLFEHERALYKDAPDYTICTNKRHHSPTPREQFFLLYPSIVHHHKKGKGLIHDIMTKVATTQTAKAEYQHHLALEAAASRLSGVAAGAAPISPSSTRKKTARTECTEVCSREQGISLWRIEGGEDSMEAMEAMEAMACCPTVGVLLARDQEIAIAKIRSLGRELRDLKVGAGCWIGVLFGERRYREAAIWAAGLLSVWSLVYSSNEPCLTEASEDLKLSSRYDRRSSME